MRGVTMKIITAYTRILISTHTPHARRDLVKSRFQLSTGAKFQLTRLMRGVTVKLAYDIIAVRHFNSHASCEAWPLAQSCAFTLCNFNSHASCEAWHKKSLFRQEDFYFNSHASCEAWHIETKTAATENKFQLTRLMRGVTFTRMNPLFPLAFQLTRLMRGVTTKCPECWNREMKFQLTRLMRGVTTLNIGKFSASGDFNSHASCEAWLSTQLPGIGMYNFNSHASCEAWPKSAIRKYFN